jgi:hypothetical protein
MDVVSPGNLCAVLCVVFCVLSAETDLALQVMAIPPVTAIYEQPTCGFDTQVIEHVCTRELTGIKILDLPDTLDMDKYFLDSTFSSESDDNLAAYAAWCLVRAFCCPVFYVLWAVSCVLCDVCCVPWAVCCVLCCCVMWAVCVLCAMGCAVLLCAVCYGLCCAAVCLG